MLINLLYASIGTLGFGMIFKTNKNKYIYVILGGFLNYLSYYLTFKYTNNIFISCLFCALITSIYSNMMAYIVKCPSTIFILTGLIPIVPGSSLFYTMQNLVLGNSKLAIKYGTLTLEVILGIVSGMLLYSVISALIKEIKKYIK